MVEVVLAESLLPMPRAVAEMILFRHWRVDVSAFLDMAETFAWINKTNGIMAEWRNGRMPEWQKGRMSEW